jgi:hypothetical protein
MIDKKCSNCDANITVRMADHKRGWGKFCNKSCKAKHQEKRTGQYKAYINGRGVSNLHPERMKKYKGKMWISTVTRQPCDPFDDDGYLHDWDDDTHPFSSEALGQS